MPVPAQTIRRPSGEQPPKGEWVSLIDIIFQLLIYFMVTMVMGTAQKRATERLSGQEMQAIPNLPAVPKLAEVPEKIEGLVFHVDIATKGRYAGQMVSYILDAKHPTIEDVEKDTLADKGPWPLSKGKRELQERVEDEIFKEGKPPALTIRAHRQVKFGDILDILAFCDVDSINQVSFRFTREEE